MFFITGPLSDARRTHGVAGSLMMSAHSSATSSQAGAFKDPGASRKIMKVNLGFKNLEKNVLYQTPHDLGLMGS